MDVVAVSGSIIPGIIQEFWSLIVSQIAKIRNGYMLVRVYRSVSAGFLFCNSECLQCRHQI